MTTLDVNIGWQMNGTAAQATFTCGDGVTALIGPSGAGKSTLARLIAGLLAPDSGHIRLAGHTITGLAPEQRGIGLVPQDSALFPHLNVARNISFGARLPARDVDALVSLMGLTPLMGRMPHSLSGGEARRVAIVRALAAKPRFLILDEPATGLDPRLRADLMGLIRTVNRQNGTPVLLITHQIEDMLATADKAVLMATGTTLCHGAIDDVLAHPDTARMLGLDDAGSLLHLCVTGRADGLIEAKFGSHCLYLPDDGEPIGSCLRLRILARDIALSKQPVAGVSILNQIECQLDTVTPRPQGFDLHLVATGSAVRLKSRITAKSHAALALTPGDTVYALIKAAAVKEILGDAPGP